jgi:transposase
MLAGIDVNQRNVVIAYKKNNRIKFIKIKRDAEDKIIAYSILEKLIENGISEVAIEDPEILNEDTLNINPSEENCKNTKNIVSFLEKLKEILESLKIKVIPVNPRNTSNICPICKEEIKTGAINHHVYCIKCGRVFQRDEIASWNIMRRGEKEKLKIKVVA